MSIVARAALLSIALLACGDSVPSDSSMAGGPPAAGIEASGGSAGITAGSGGISGSSGSGGASGITVSGMGGMLADPIDAGSDAGGLDAGVDASAPDGSAPEPQDLPQALRDLGIVALYPAPGSLDQCPDPALRIVFASAAPELGVSGKLEVFDAASPALAIASIDLAIGTTTMLIDGATYNVERAAYVEGNELVFYPSPRALGRGSSYVVRVAAAGIAIDDDSTWRFSVAADEPRDPKALRVASDGAGDFCQLQSALDFSASDGATIEIGRGTYHGIVHFENKTKLTIRGEDRKATILAGTNNENLNGGTAKRALIGVDTSSNITFQTLTIHNRTPQGGSQAEALRMQRCDRCSVRDADIISLQDTLLWSGTVYAKDCYIAGNVDFIWGTGAAYFDSCEIKTLGRKGYTVQARNGAGGYGYVFVDSRMTSDPGITGHWLGRIDASAYPSSHVAYIDCELGPHIDPAGWQVTGFGGGALRFWEYGSKSPSGAPVDISDRHSSSRQLTSTEAAEMRDPSAVLGGWTPE
jgi:pectin methylesterase-like acyl-CoA thioesterase